MAEMDSTHEEQIANLNRLIEEGHESAEREGTVSAEELRRMLDQAKARRPRDRQRQVNAGN